LNCDTWEKCSTRQINSNAWWGPREWFCENVFVKYYQTGRFNSTQTIIDHNGVTVDQDKYIYDKIIKFENFENDITEIGKRLNLNDDLFKIFKNIKVNEFKSSNKKERVEKNIIDTKSQEIIFDCAKKIFEDYNYKKEITSAQLERRKPPFYTNLMNTIKLASIRNDI